MALKVSVKTYYIYVLEDILKKLNVLVIHTVCSARINAVCKRPDQLDRKPRILRECQFERSGSAVKEAECDMRDEEADRT